MKKAATIVLLLGSNQADPKRQLATARQEIAGRIGPVRHASNIYLTEAWGVEDQPDFLNQALLVESTIRPRELLNRIHAIEADMGRIRQERWGPRPIDIDILFYNQEVVNEPGLRIPHPGIPDRNFTLIPLLELIPEWKHPQLGKSIEELYWESDDSLEVYKMDDLTT